MKYAIEYQSIQELYYKLSYRIGPQVAGNITWVVKSIFLIPNYKAFRIPVKYVIINTYNTNFKLIASIQAFLSSNYNNLPNYP